MRVNGGLMDDWPTAIFALSVVFYNRANSFKVNSIKISLKKAPFYGIFSIAKYLSITDMEAHDKQELIALIDYMIHHNEHHNEELKELASSLKDISQGAYAKVEEAINEFKKGNLALEEALKELGK